MEQGYKSLKEPEGVYYNIKFAKNMESFESKDKYQSHH